MQIYSAPIRDMQFVLYELHDAAGLTALDSFSEVSRDLVDPVLAAAAKFSSQILQPLNLSGDQQGCKLTASAVSTPDGFKQAYQQFCQGGWTAFCCDPEYGGMGMPKSIHSMVEEMFCSANLSFGMYPGLSFGAYHALHSFASQQIKDKYLAKLVDGSFSGTMCLTEPQCGTDLGLCRTQAIPCEDGSYLITGNKIFISAGEHDLSENIIHLVLARTPESPAGIKGISLFVVPKLLDDEQGQASLANNVLCTSIEQKMGIKASATCSMSFEQSRGWLVGELNKGMQGMFAMMNRARLAVGVQGLGLSEVAYQAATAYAKERLQGRSLAGAKYPEQAADPIIVHPDVRRMLLTMRAYTQGCRAYGAWVSQEYDYSNHHPDKKRRQAADEFVQLSTPIVKSLFTDLGFECTNLGMQVLGGHGYIHESGLEQYVRDCRITQIYEGTNGIQALDLIGRKLPYQAGRYLRRFFHPVQEYIEANIEDPEQAEFVQPLAKAFSRLQQATGRLAQVGLSDPEQAAAVASEYLRLFGLVALAFMWCRMTKIAVAKVNDDTTGFYAAKLTTGRFYMQKILPQSSALFASIMVGGEVLMALDEEQF
ncbi:MAG: acyl-CoA dehydrogenase C-terminal domain-containing protein [Pseudomonadales bacterium]|nr:acyl-CoA dehydrogenase C-terminal domain-containing protein [Pseudomonadales bacterium]NRA16540.1 acyl-CoA dehydrogenase C-terminal domain-containing protein [Oceanospirillaceae bacterium]